MITILMTLILLKFYKLIVDGMAGNLTIGALVDFQKKHGLTADGICGPATRAAVIKGL